MPGMTAPIATVEMKNTTEKAAPDTAPIIAATRDDDAIEWPMR